MVRAEGVVCWVMVSEKLVLMPAELAVTVSGPGDELTVNAGAVAMPLELVTTFTLAAPLKLPLGPTVNVTVTPESDWLYWLVTETASSVAAWVPSGIDWLFPEVMVRAEGVVCWVMVREKVVLTPAVFAVTMSGPGEELTVNAGAVAIPLELVTTFTLAAPLKLPLGPTLNVTVTPESGWLYWLVTETASGVAA